MASLLVHIEVDGPGADGAAALAPRSLRVLGEGRRIATSLGACLHACVRLTDDEKADLDGVTEALGRAGADKVHVWRGPSSEPVLWATHGGELQALCEELHPLLVLLTAGPAGAELAPRLAAALGAAFVAEPALERGPRGEIVFSRAVFAGTQRRRLATEEIEHAVVATLSARSCQAATGGDEAELRLVPPRTTVTPPPEVVAVRDDPDAALENARVVVVAGAGVKSFETYALVEELATALGGVVAATRSLCEKGIAPADREIGVGVRRIAPELLFLCGVSGSSATLSALSGDADLVAIDHDPNARIFRVAQYGLVGNLETLLPDLINAVRARVRSGGSA